MSIIRNTKNIRLAAGLAVAALVLIGASCNPFTPTTPAPKPVTLEYWRIADRPDALKGIIDSYRKIHPYVTINLREFTAETYPRELLVALAENRGPDIFSLSNVDLRGWKTRLLPMPTELQVPTVTVNDQQQIVTQSVKKPTLTLRELRDNFVEAAVRDMLMWTQPDDPKKQIEQRVYGFPLSLDTIGLYYNRDLLKKANIEKPPATWNDFLNQVQALTLRETGTDNLRQSGAAIGTSANVQHSTDLLAAIMLQNGAMLEDASGTPAFDQYTPGTSDKAYPPGVEALLFYDSFSDPYSQNYTWNSKLPNSLDAFVSGQTAFYFGFPTDAATIVERAPRLSLGIASLPQVEPNKVGNLAHYPFEVVSRKTANPNQAWDFLQYAAEPEQVVSYLQVTKRPTALRSLLKDQVLNPDIAPFANQTLTAKSWYRGTDYTKVEDAFAYMIDTRPTQDNQDYRTIVSTAKNAVAATVPGDY